VKCGIPKSAKHLTTAVQFNPYRSSLNESNNNQLKRQRLSLLSFCDIENVRKLASLGLCVSASSAELDVQAIGHFIDANGAIFAMYQEVLNTGNSLNFHELVEQ
jgi:hypothetical protein